MTGMARWLVDTPMGFLDTMKWHASPVFCEMAAAPRNWPRRVAHVMALDLRSPHSSRLLDSVVLSPAPRHPSGLGLGLGLRIR